MAGDTVDDPEGEDREAERDRDRKAAGPRDRARMIAPAAWDVQHAEPFREPADKRCDRG